MNPPPNSHYAKQVYEYGTCICHLRAGPGGRNGAYCRQTNPPVSDQALCVPDVYVLCDTWHFPAYVVSAGTLQYPYSPGDT